MGSTRFFDGNREKGKRSIASELIRIEIQKGGKFTPAERYKRMLKASQDERKTGLPGGGESSVTRFKRLLNSKVGEGDKALKKSGGLHGGSGGRQLSKNAMNALKEVAAKKAAKEAKALRKMVLVTPKIYPNGRLVRNGKIYDIADNVVAKINTKNGKITTNSGWSVGKYKPKSFMTHQNIQDAINKHSPYFINLRKMQAMQQGQNPNAGVWARTDDTISLHGHTPPPTVTTYDAYGSDFTGPKQNITVTVHGASTNVWGTFADNVWGTSADNVWGGVSSNVWGGINSSAGLWGVKGQHVWGTGNGKNYLRGITKFLVAFFGLKDKASRDRNATRLAAYQSSRSGGSTARSASVARSAPVAPTRSR